MLRVGLTGGIAAGKSTVSRRLAALGAVVIDADAIAREVVEPGTPGFDAVVTEFGPSVVGADGSLDRPALGRLVFADDARREALNAIVHPLVYTRRTALVEAAPPDAVVVEDIPLLVENGLAAAYHLVVVVHAPERERIRRLVDDRGMAEADARARIAAQASDAERRAAADVWLDNVGDPATLETRVDDLWANRLVPFEENLRNGRPARLDPEALPESVPTDPTWPGQAERLAGRLARAAGEHTPQIRHVGPTAEPGRPAPDVIDLDVVVPDLVAADALVAAAARAGFVPMPPGRAGPGPDRRLVEADPGRPVNIRLKLLRDHVDRGDAPFDLGVSGSDRDPGSQEAQR